jgi:hypothetical protein
MLQTAIDSLQAERLMEHLRVLSDQIGPRPPTSREERRAAEYARQILEHLGVEDIRDQFFTSAESNAWSLFPYAALGALASMFRGTLGKLVGGAALLYAVRGLVNVLLAKPQPHDSLMAQGTSQNVVARLAPTGVVKRRIFLIAHLDSGKQPLPVPEAARPYLKPLGTLGLVLTAACGAVMIAEALAGKRKVGTLQKLVGLMSLGSLAALFYRENQPYEPGANDNASAVAVLLGLAEALKAQPLAHTEVQLLFTGCKEAGCVGIEKYLNQYAPPKHNSYWIDLEKVGAGQVCYVTGHGLSHLSDYRPTPQITALAARLARERAELGVTGRELPVVDELAPVVRRGYEAICISGYSDRQDNSAGDTVDSIEPDTLARAAQYTYALVQEIDRL